MPHPVIPQSAIKMKRRNQKETLDNLERQNVLFHKVKILLQNDPELADTFLRYIGNYTKAYIVTEKFLLDMHDIKCLNEICPSSLKETTDSDSGGVQGATNDSKRENDGTATSFGAAMFGVVYNDDLCMSRYHIWPLDILIQLKHRRTPLPWIPWSSMTFECWVQFWGWWE